MDSKQRGNGVVVDKNLSKVENRDNTNITYKDHLDLNVSGKN